MYIMLFSYGHDLPGVSHIMYFITACNYSLNVRDQVLYPYETRGKIIVLYQSLHF